MKTEKTKGSFAAMGKWFYAFAATAVVLVGAIVAILVLTLGGAQEPPAEGAETGVYYYDAALGEYLLSLNGGENFTLAGPDVNKTGKYTVSENTLTLDFVRDEDGTATATLNGTSISLVYRDATLNFIKKIPYTVTFNSNGGSDVPSLTVINGKTALKPNDPSKEGGVFLGWYADEALTQAFFFGLTPVTADTTVYAKWADVVPGQTEYVVDFDLGYEGGAMNAISTVGGKLVFGADYATPTREGYTFVGWFASAYEDGAKLTYEVVENATLKADTTLFAVWNDDAAALQAPAVSVVGNSITWKSVEGAISYAVTIKDAEGNVLFDQSVGTTTLTYDFAASAAGDYTVTVVAKGNGDAVSAAAVRCYQNKGLDRVYKFEVVGDTLIFNAVEGAQKYLITVDCGNAQHNHTLFDNGLSTYFNFANCQMQPGGIAFTVTAVANGYASSVSETFYVVRNLDQVSDIAYDAATATFTWGAVANATKYYVTVTCGAHTHATVDNGALTSYSVKECTGDITIAVLPAGVGSNSPEATTTQITKTVPATPANITINGTTVTWDAVEGAKSYTVKVNGTSYNVTTTSYNLMDTGISFNVGSKHTITVAAVGETAVSLASDALEVSYLALGALSYNQNTVSWAPVLGVNRFDVRVNGGEITTVNANEAVVELTRAGINTIEVRTAGFATTSEWATIEVYAYEIVYESRSLGGSVKEYVAKGDKMSLPTDFTYAGFNFDGWYNAPAAAQGNGAAYTDTVFNGNGNTTLYANWDPKSYTITFTGINGTMSGAVNGGTATVTYTKDFKLPVMTTTDLIKSNFAGWYTGADGTGVKLTDYLGNSVAPYNVTGDIEAHPYFTSGLIFDMQNDGTYSVKKGTDINTIPVITIPAYYNGIAVTTILENAFYNCDYMVEVNIPDTIKLIGTGAFNSCDRLVAFNVYPVATETPHETFYSSYNGALIYEDVASGYTYLEAFPRAKKGDFFVPENVDIIRNRAFNYAQITSVTISKEVKILGDYAFSNCRYLKSITFEEGSTTPISVANSAFYGCYSVTSIKLPALIKGSGEGEAFDIHTLDGLTGLQKIEVEKVTGAYFSAVEGMLCNDLGDTILYCPSAYNGLSGVLTIPKGITNIGDGTFQNRNVFTEIIIPNYVINIGNNAFYGCRNVTKVTFAGMRTRDLTIGASAFYGCSNVREIIFEGNGSGVVDAGAATIGAAAFGGMNELRTLTVEAGANVAEIGDRAFAANLKLRTINVAEGAVVAKIGNAAFKGCEGITAFTIPASTTEIGDSAFADCAFLSKIAFAPNGQNIAFGTYVFQNCVALSRVELPATVQKFDGSAFDGCYSLKEIIVDPNNTFLTTKDGVLYSKDFSEIMFYPKGIEDPTLSKLPWDKLTVIGNTVFKDNTNITSVTIPNTVTVIGDGAFDGCINLSSVTIAGGGTSLSVGNMAFANCQKLTSIDLPSYTTKIGNAAFYVTPLTSFTIPASVTTIGDQAFMYTNLTSIHIPASVTTIGDGAFAYSKLTSITFDDGNAPLVLGPKTDLSINYNVEKVSPNRDVVFPNHYIGVQAIGVFTGTKISSLALPARLTTIGAFAFYGITSLKTVTFAQNANLTTIGDGAFYGSGLTAINLEDTTVATIGEYAFAEAHLTSVKFPNTIALIDKYAFTDNGNISGSSFTGTLASVEFATGGTTQLTVREQAFRNSVFAEITFPKNLTNCSQEIMVVSDDPTYGVRMPSFYQIFEGNYKLSAVNVEDGCELYGSLDGVFYFKSNGALTHLVFCPPAKTGEYTVPNTVTKVAHRAFWASQLSTVTFAELPEDHENYGKPILEIGNAATSTTNALFPVFGGYGSATRTANALYYNNTATSIAKLVQNSHYVSGNKITQINFPSHLGLIASYGIMRLDTTGAQINFNMDANEVSFNSQAVYNNQGLTELHLPRTKSLSQRGDWQDCTFASNKKVHTITFAEGSTFTLLPHRCFDGCSALTSIEIPANVTMIEEKCFQNCTKLTTVTFAPGSQLAAIEIDAFAKTGIKEFTIPDTVTFMGSTVFNGGSLEKITIGRGLESISAHDVNGNITTFLRGASKLKEIAVANGHSTLLVEDGVLYDLNKTIIYCFPRGMKASTFTVPATVRTIAPYAFEYFGGNIVLPEGLTHIQVGAFHSATFASVVIPSTVVEIGNQAFYRNSKTLTSVTIPQNSQLTTLGNQAFYYGGFTSIYLPDSISKIGYGCFSSSKLQSVILPAALKRMEYSTFSGNTDLATVILQGNLEYIAQQAFTGCSSLQSITIPASVHTMDYQIFVNNTSLESVTFEEGSRLSTLSYQVFMGCSSLKSITLPEGLSSVGLRLFDGCTSLEYVDMSKTSFTTLESSLSSKIWWGFFNECYALKTVLLPETLEVIDENCFKDLANLKEIHIPSSVTTLRDGAFDGCTSLEKVTFGEDSALTALGAHSFRNTHALTEIKLPAYLESMGANIFENSGLTSISFPETLTAISTGAFKGCEGLTEINIPATVMDVNDEAFMNCVNVQTLTIAEGVETLGASAFGNCNKVAEIVVPVSVTRMGGNPFADCTGVTNFSLASGNENFLIDQFGVLYDANVRTIIFYPPYLTAETYELPSTVYEIASSAFAGSQMTHFVIPDTIKVVPAGCFKGSAKLQTVTIPLSILSIEAEAFMGCSSLNNVAIPSSCTYIGDSAFENCSSLTEFDFGTRNTTLNVGIALFRGCTSYENVILPDGLTAIPDYMFANTGIKHLVIPESVTNMSGTGLFMDCAKLESVEFSENVSGRLGAKAFYNCTALKSIVLPEGITSFGDSDWETDDATFMNCTALESVTLNESIYSFGTHAFENCTSLKEIDMSECWDLWEISQYAFRNCTSLETVIFSESSYDIYEDAFAGCTALKGEIHMPYVWFYGGFFKGCTGIEALYIYGFDGIDNYDPVDGDWDNGNFAGWTSEQTIYFVEMDWETLLYDYFYIDDDRWYYDYFPFIDCAAVVYDCDGNQLIYDAEAHIFTQVVTPDGEVLYEYGE